MKNITNIMITLIIIFSLSVAAMSQCAYIAVDENDVILESGVTEIGEIIYKSDTVLVFNLNGILHDAPIINYIPGKGENTSGFMLGTVDGSLSFLELSPDRNFVNITNYYKNGNIISLVFTDNSSINVVSTYLVIYKNKGPKRNYKRI
jgi:hypothetical protein